MGMIERIRYCLSGKIGKAAARRFLSAVLAVCLTLSLSPVPASASFFGFDLNRSGFLGIDFGFLGIDFGRQEMPEEDTEEESGGDTWVGVRNNAEVHVESNTGEESGANTGANAGTNTGANAGEDPEESIETVVLEEAGTYALVVATGGLPGNTIQYFKVVYEDVYGVQRTEFIFKDDMKKGLTEAAEIANPQKRLSVRERFQYTGVHNYGYVWDTSLQPYSTDTFLFHPTYAVKDILRVEVMQGGGAWDCQGMWLYEVESVHGVEMLGYISNNYIIDFSGYLLAELEMNRSGGELVYTTFQSGESRVFRIGEGGHPEYTLRQIPEEEREYVHVGVDKEYAFRLDIADVAGAGLDDQYNQSPRFNRCGRPISEIKFHETLAMTVRYTTTQGCTIETVLPVTASALGWALENGVSEDEILAGIGQQGDQVMFAVLLPNFADLVQVRLEYMERTAGDSTVAEDETVQLTGISLYDLSLSQVSVGYNEKRSAIEPTIQVFNEPVYYWKAAGKQGQSLSMGDGPSTYQMRLNETGIRMEAEDFSDQYLVEIETDAMASAATTSDIYLTLTYVTMSGTDQRINRISIAEQAKDFYGYTNGSTTSAYLRGVSSGGTLRFVINANNVNYFTGASVSLENGKDDWQMAGLRVYQLESLSKRNVTWVEDQNIAFVDRAYDRDFDGRLVFSSGRSMLVQGGETQTVDTTEGGGAFSESTVPELEVAWDDIRYSMSFEESQQVLGFSKSRETYQVDVQVAGNTGANGDNGDAGSKNQFYFQLIFQNGASGYVLANQQLSGDGFRAGYLESFNVETNRDYGDLVSVRIIPEDISSKSDSFDKLNIDSIQVIKKSNSGLSRQWVLENVGWIDIDYQDEGAASGMVGQKGRTEAEISSVCSVTFSTYAVNLLFSISTLATPFNGTLMGDLCYYSTSGEVKHKSFDVVKLMYEYANKTAVYNSGTDSNGNISVIGSARSDNSFMFRGDHTDRFSLSVSDVSELIYLNLTATAVGLMQGTGETWHIGGVSAALITSEGVLHLNENDEYERSNETRFLASNVDTGSNPAYQVLLEKDSPQEAKVYFTENEIEMDVKTTNISVLSREPISQNDTLNIYVYPNYGMSEPTANYTIKAAVRYTAPQGLRQASAGELHLSEDETTFYMIGVQAPGMTVLNDMTIQAGNSMYTPSAYIDYAVIQQVRSGVVIDTYTIDFNDGAVAYGCTARPNDESTDAAEVIHEEQEVMISIGSDLETTLLQSETKDMAVALRYTTINDPTGTNREYDSPFIYLTDQQYSSLRAGQVVTLTFREPYIRDITGVVMVATGGLSVPVEMACVGTYDVSSVSHERVQTGWYSFSGFTDGMAGQSVGRADRVLGETGESVKPLKVTFVTAPADVNMESGTDGPVEMTISFVDDVGQIRTWVIDDIRTYLITENGFATDSTAQIELLVSGMQELRWLNIRPYDDKEDTDVSWRLSSVTAELGVGKSKQTDQRAVDSTKTIMESEGRKINLSDIKVKVNAHTESSTGRPTDVNVINGTESILMESGRTATITPEIIGSDEGCTVSVVRVAKEGDATADASNLIVSNGAGGWVFSPGHNYTGVDQFYRITVTSNEVAASSVINITLEFEEKPVEVERPPAAEGETEETDGETADETGTAGSEDQSGTAGTDTGASGDAGGAGNTGDTGTGDTGGTDA